MEQLLRAAFKKELDGYAQDYLEETGNVISQSYLDEQLEAAVQAAVNNPDVLGEDPIDTWELDWFRELLYDECSCTIHIDYPM